MTMIVSVCDYSGAWSRPFVEAGYVVLRVDPKHGEYEFKDGKAVRPLTSDFIFKRDSHAEDYSLGLTAGEFADYLEDHNGFLGHLFGSLWARPPEWAGGVAGVLLAPPCTDFAVSGARWFKAKDADGRTDASVAIVRDCLRVVERLKPDWWALEQPVSRLARLVPEVGKVRKYVHPWYYAGFADDPDSEAYTKKTTLYGTFNPDFPENPRDPVMYTTKGGKQGSWMWANLGGNSERTKELRSKTPTGFARAFARAQINPNWRAK